jgi:hypothetical protein
MGRDPPRRSSRSDTSTLTGASPQFCDAPDFGLCYFLRFMTWDFLRIL